MINDNSNQPLISVVVCTFNRGALVKHAVNSLIDQSIEKNDMEIILIDNNSSDDTLKILKENQSNYIKPKIIIVTETRQGLGFARNRGVKESKGKYIAFMDDDALADRKWLENALDLFKNFKPTPLAIGGPILPFYNSVKPSWFKDEYETRTWGDKLRLLKPKESFSGSNMIFRKDIIEKSGGFNVKVGMTGEYISVGEETALFDNIWSNYGESIHIVYAPNLIVYHLVEKYKMTVWYQLKRSFAAGQSYYVMNEPKTILKKVRIILGLIKSILIGGGLSVVNFYKYQNIKSWTVEMIAPIISNIGILLLCFGIHLSVKKNERQKST